jgi:hypothetical protein
MTPSIAIVAAVDMGHATSPKAPDAACAEATHVTSAEPTHVAATKAAAHVASATSTVPTAATATAGLRARGKQAARKQRTCQNHHRSSSHDILHWDGRYSATGLDQTLARFRAVDANVAMDSRWGWLSVVSTKFAFSHPR